MGKPLDSMTFTATRRPGEWDGSWMQDAPELTVQLNGDPTPKSTATLDDVTEFTATEYAIFYDSSGAVLGAAKIVSIDGGTGIITFVTDSLAWDAEVGDRVMPGLQFDGSRPQPVGSEQTAFLDEGARAAARYIIYVEDDQPELYLVGRDREGYSADTVAYNGENYLLASDDDWNGRPLGYRGYVMIEFAPDEEVPS
jgi:hypothetical protein